MPKRTTHSNRHAYLSEGFRNYLRRNLHGFRSLADHIQLELVSMIVQAPTKYREHSHYEGWASFHYEYLNKKFGRGKFEAINQKLGVFLSAPDWSKVEGRTKPYKLTDKVAELRTQFLASHTRRAANLLTEDGKILRTEPKQALESRRKTPSGSLVGRSGWHGKPVLCAVPVNKVMLRKLATTIDTKLYSMEYGFQPDLLHDEPDPDYLRELLDEVRIVLHHANQTAAPGKVLHRYTQTNSGRLYAHNVNLQNAYRPVRQAALHGLYDYDIENCHYSILDQLAERHGHQCDAIRDYLANRDKVRKTLAAEFEVQPKQVKQALLALIYGASFSEDADKALPKILGSVATAQAFYVHPMFKALGDDIEAARSAILEGPKKVKLFRGNITNLRGLTMQPNRQNGHRQLLAHLLQGVESMALEACHDLYGEQIVLLQHDGFTATTSQLSVSGLEDAIAKNTQGYRLKIGKPEQILVTLDAAFSDHPKVSDSKQIEPQPNIHAGLSQSLVS
jgi:hypothetical protein